MMVLLSIDEVCENGIDEAWTSNGTQPPSTRASTRPNVPTTRWLYALHPPNGLPAESSSASAMKQPAPNLSERDLEVIRFVGKFKQVSSSHIKDRYFTDVSHNVPYQVLTRLVKDQWLQRIERRIVGGHRGGSGQYVYQLGRRGFYLLTSGRYQPARAIDFHRLAITDCFIELKRIERTGLISVVAVSTEPDCWEEVAGMQLKPDMLVDVSTVTGARLKLWLEMDMGSEGQRQIKAKLETYWRAYQEADWSVFPAVVWVGVDEERAVELAWLIEQGSAEAQRLFKVATRDTLIRLFTY